MMTPMQIYSKLAEADMSLERAVVYTDQLRRLQAKQATFDPTKLLSGLASITSPFVKATFIAPPVAGYLAGSLLAKSMDADSGNVADIQEQELVAELLANTEALKRRQKLREQSGTPMLR